MKGNRKPDFQGWATKNNLVCADGLVIKENAFAVNDGKRVPLVFGHQHFDPSKVLGHAILKNMKGGVYAYCYLNNSQAAKDTREAIQHGDIDALSIFATNLQKNGKDVVHGIIKEVSVVLAGANPGAFIESVLEHGEPMDDYEDQGILFTGENIVLQHADEPPAQNSKSKDSENGDGDKTVEDVLDTLTDEQKAAVGILLQGIEEEFGVNDDEGGDEMKHYNAFENNDPENQDAAGVRYLQHDDIRAILKAGRQCGSLRAAFDTYVKENDIVLAHSLDTTGMEVPTATPAPTYGINGIDMLRPEIQPVTNQPEFIGRNVDWVKEIMQDVSYTPFLRIKSLFADITEDEARAKGYIKGKQKKEEVFSILKRTTEAQMIYKKQKIDRDDILDVEDWDILPWIKAEMDVMFEEEKARAILIGDGRLLDDDDKIKEDRIRPVVSDVALFNTKITVNTTADENLDAELLIDSIIRGRKKYKGSGNPKFYTTEDVLTEMLLLKDKNGNRIYKTEEELAAALRVKKIVTVEPMTGTKVNGKDLIGVMVNMADYKIGGRRDKKDFFEDFDIDYNQQKYLLEQKMSGAMVKPFGAVTFLAAGKTSSDSSSDSSSGSSSDDTENK